MDPFEKCASDYVARETQIKDDQYVAILDMLADLLGVSHEDLETCTTRLNDGNIQYKNIVFTIGVCHEEVEGWTATERDEGVDTLKVRTTNRNHESWIRDRFKLGEFLDQCAQGLRKTGY